MQIMHLFSAFGIQNTKLALLRGNISLMLDACTSASVGIKQNVQRTILRFPTPRDLRFASTVIRSIT